MAGTRTNTPKAELPANRPSVLKAKQVEDQTKPAKPVEPAAEKPRTIRSICEEGLLAGLAYDQIIAKVKVVHPGAETTPFIDLLSRGEYTGAQLVISGAAFTGLRGAHTQRLSHVYVA